MRQPEPKLLTIKSSGGLPQSVMVTAGGVDTGLIGHITSMDIAIVADDLIRGTVHLAMMDIDVDALVDLVESDVTKLNESLAHIGWELRKL